MKTSIYFLLAFIFFMMISCNMKRPQNEYKIKEITAIDSVVFRDYFEKQLGIIMKKQKVIYTYQILCSNQNHDTIITIRNYKIKSGDYIGKIIRL